MKTKVFAIYDSKALAYGVPFFMPAVGAAVRAFADLANDGNSSLSRHASDYILYEIGVFDDSDGSLIGIQPFVNLGCGADFLPVRVPGKTPTMDMSPLDRDVILNGGSK
jgi:hypothetical protein